VQQANNPGHLLRRLWKEDGEWTAFVYRHRVALIDQQFCFIGDDRGWSDDLAE
jgi:hypothetical protein